MSIQPDLTQLTRRLDRLEEELRAARQQLQALEFAKQTQSLERAAFAADSPATAEPSSAAPFRDALVAAKSERARPSQPAYAESTGGTSVPPAAAIPSPSRPSAEPPPLPQAWEPLLPRHVSRAETSAEPAPSAVNRPPDDAPAGPSPVQEWLEKLQLWPPSGDGNMEARLGAWWATRVGTLLAVIGIVFFGIWASRGTPAWVRFTELLLVSAGVAALGLWLERKVEKFGAVVFAGGLALIYYCAFAGYAVQSVKVFDHVAVAAGWQLAAVALLAGAAVWRRSPLVATMGVALGYVTAFFSHAEGLREFALGAAWLLAAVAVVFHRWKRWEAPAVLALPATFATYAVVLARDWLPGSEAAPARGWVWLLLAAAGALFFARDWRSQRTTAAEVTLGERWFQGANSSLLALAGLATAGLLYRAHLAEFYFGLAAVFAIGAGLRRRQVEGDLVGAVLVAKAAGALTLGVIEQCQGRTVAIALLVQAWVTLWCARRLKSRVLAWATGVVALAAAGFYAQDAQEGAVFLSAAGAGEIGFVIGLALLGAEAARRLVPETAREARQITEAAGAALAGGLGALTAANWHPAPWAAAGAAVLSLLLFAVGAARRAWGPALAGTIVLLAGHALVWLTALRTQPGGAALWWCALAVLAPTVALGALLGGRWLERTLTASGPTAASDAPTTTEKPQPVTEAARAFAVAGTAAWGLTVAGAALVLFNQWSAVPALLVCTLLALGLGAAAPLLPERRLPWLATLAAAAGTVLWLGGGAGEDPRAGLTLAALALWALPVGAAAWPRHAVLLQREPGAALLRVIQLALAAAVTLKLFGALFAGTGLVFALALLALGTSTLVWWPGLAAALPLSWVFWAAAGLVAAIHESVGKGALPALSALLAWMPSIALVHTEKIVAFGAQDQKQRRIGVGVQTVLAVLGTLVVAEWSFRNIAELAALTAGIVVAGLVLRLGRVTAARKGAVALAVVAWLKAGTFTLDGRAEGSGNVGLLAVLLVAATLVAAPLALAGGPKRLQPRGRNALAWGLGTPGLALAFLALYAQRHGGELHRYVTVGWGAVAVAVFLTGLFARLRPHRLLGLLGLALCVPRAFIVDLDSPLLRIIAFIALGGVLLWVGFSYHKFRHLIADAAAEPDKTHDNPNSEAPR